MHIPCRFSMLDSRWRPSCYQNKSWLKSGPHGDEAYRCDIYCAGRAVARYEEPEAGSRAYGGIFADLQHTRHILRLNFARSGDVLRRTGREVFGKGRQRIAKNSSRTFSEFVMLYTAVCAVFAGGGKVLS